MLKACNILFFIFSGVILFLQISFIEESQASTWQLPLKPPIPSGTYHFHSIIPIPIQSDSFRLQKTKNKSRFENALQALRKNMLDKALHTRDLITENSLERDILTWIIAITDSQLVSSMELQKALQKLQGWPGKHQIQKNFESALLREKTSSQKIITAFEKKKPETVIGMTLLIQALLQRGQKDKARAFLIPWWYTVKLNSKEEQMLLDKAGTLLQKEDYQRRFEIMLYAYKFSSTKKLASLAGGVFFHKFFMAVYNRTSSIKEMSKYVEDEWKQRPVYSFIWIQYLRNNGNYEQAANLLLKIQAQSEKLTEMDVWWKEQRVLSRELLDIGKIKLAYQVVANHTFNIPLLIADAEFHAGWYALRFLKDPDMAFRHFFRIGEVSSRPISQARSLYWMGRASEKLHKKEKAHFYFRQAARYSSTFYGQLANARLNNKTLEMFYPNPTKQERFNFSNKYFVKVIKILEQAGYNREATIFYHTLTEQLTSNGELSLLSAMAEKKGDYQTCLKIGKKAILIGFSSVLAYPLGAIPDSAFISSSLKQQEALVYAVARQESEFNKTAVSKANARGILQLMPSTARSIASRHGMTFSLRKLSNDPVYNARLGVYYLEEQLKIYKNSYLLTFIAYNAGAGRVKEWIARYGDPRKYTLDEIVDWIERIPFSETRNYVQRVMENYQIYKTRLKKQTNIEHDLVVGHVAI